MSTELSEFHTEFFQDIHGTADADGRYAEDAFFEIFCAQLVHAGELETADRAPCNSPRGVRVDGYGGDPAAADGVLSLIVSDFSQEKTVSTLIASDMDAIFKRLSNFLTRALDSSLRNQFEETSAGFGLADLIARRWPAVSKVRMFLISNRVLSTRVDGREAGEFRGIPVTYSVWDLGRLHRFVAAGQRREEILIDLAEDFGGALPVLPAHLDAAGYEAYLAVIPGQQLAKIYDRYGARLLEQNVRVFLQARGGVNKGIRTTIEQSPDMFFAYNNGITATAEKVIIDGAGRGLAIRAIHNLQIVNGGQTTASIHAASRKKDIDLSKVFVQMKLSVVEHEKAIEVVPKISEYANSQNRVNAADFFANHPFHVQIEKFSRRTFAPSPDGTFRDSKWFYERARGQYQDARALLTPAQRKKFDLEYPKAQVVEKTDLAKFLTTWQGRPDIVSKGAQKNFAQFALATGKEWAKNPDAFNERFFRHSIAKAIIFLTTERLVPKQPWYQGGFRANIVAYAISKLVHDAGKRGQTVDLERVWKAQAVSEQLNEALTLAARSVNDILINPPSGMSNVTEWAKQQACWNTAAGLQIDWPKGFISELISEAQHYEEQTDARRDQQLVNGIEAQVIVVNAGAAVWRDLKSWGLSRRLLTEMEAGVLDVAAAIPAKLPTEKQSAVVIQTLKKLRDEGCQLGADLV